MSEVLGRLTDIRVPAGAFWMCSVIGVGILLLVAFAIHRGTPLRARFGWWLQLEVRPRSNSTRKRAKRPKPSRNKPDEPPPIDG